jgi:hypothetical protein
VALPLGVNIGILFTEPGGRSLRVVSYHLLLSITDKLGNILLHQSVKPICVLSNGPEIDVASNRVIVRVIPRCYNPRVAMRSPH